MTLNLIGPPALNLSANTTSGSPVVSPTAAKQFSLLMPTEAPLTPVPPTTTPTSTTTNQSTGPSSLQNGVSVTHYSEQRGAMEKVNCPSVAVNIFSAEIKSPKLDNHARAAAENLLILDTMTTTVPTSTSTKNNNPFLNMSPQSPLTPTHISSTNPFKSTPIPNSPKSSNAPKSLPNPFRENEHNRHQLLLDQVDLSPAASVATTVVVSPAVATITAAANNTLNATETTMVQSKMAEMNEKRVSFCVNSLFMFSFMFHVFLSY